MKYVTLKVVLTCVTLASICASGATFAQGGGNGNGGTGGGNAHGAATSGMTYHGDPVSSPINAMPGKMADKMGTSEAGPPPMSPTEAASPAKSGH
jgi:hypothetical protein